MANTQVENRDKLGRYKPGVSGNPRGNPEGQPPSLITILRRKLRQHPEDADAIVQNLIDMAKEKDSASLRATLTAIREAFDRIDGKMPLPLSGSLRLEHDITFKVGKGYEGIEERPGGN